MPSGNNGKRNRSGGNGRRNPQPGRREDHSERFYDESGNDLTKEALFWLSLLVTVILFLCNFHIIGKFGDTLSKIMFGLFGLLAYVMPVLIFLGGFFISANKHNGSVIRKTIAGIAAIILLGVVFDLFAKYAEGLEKYDIKALYTLSADSGKGGGVLEGSISYGLQSIIGKAGCIIVVIIGMIICIVMLTEKSVIEIIKNVGINIGEAGKGFKEGYDEARRERAQIAAENRMYLEDKEGSDASSVPALPGEAEGATATEGVMLPAPAEEKKREPVYTKTVREKMREKKEERAAEKELRKEERNAKKQLLREEKETERILSGGMRELSADYSDDESEYFDENEYYESDTYGENAYIPQETPRVPVPTAPVFEKIPVRNSHRVEMLDAEPVSEEDERTDYFEEYDEAAPHPYEESIFTPEPAPIETAAPVRTEAERPIGVRKAQIRDPRVQAESEKPAARKPVPAEQLYYNRKYKFPPIDLLKKGAGGSKRGSSEQKEVSERLESTLESFGVKVKVTDVSIGPTVTRYEIQPEVGVKVSRIVGLADDIKMNLAATDIRIEAPIPGKSAVGIEVPNREITPVSLRELISSPEFKDAKSKLSFAVGKDIAGKVVVTDIAKMPHVLIAGATGSGKSVCINTLIMSIIYKATPDEVQLVLIDPKVVELSVYNGIPHLATPVVTDPKKAAAALMLGVKEMEERYRKFADTGVRDLAGYNEKVEAGLAGDDAHKLPQMVIVIDELADLMMVSPGDVEMAICRIAQLARAAGIHLVVATQRPSVDVITGLIKANMPSRVAFAVSSGVDSRTILDSVGAEKLLGKGDMLFYPQGYPKPARLQGAFVSDSEVADVVEYLKNQKLGNPYGDAFGEKLGSMENMMPGGGASAGGDSDGADEYFADAGRCIIKSGKASIGYLQRQFKIGFNRAARIMDSLAEYGVVGPESGTKAREILMTEEEFESFLIDMKGM